MAEASAHPVRSVTAALPYRALENLPSTCLCGKPEAEWLLLSTRDFFLTPSLFYCSATSQSAAVRSICSQATGESDSGAEGSPNEDSALLPLKSLTAEVRAKVSQQILCLLPTCKGTYSKCSSGSADRGFCRAARHTAPMFALLQKLLLVASSH